MCTEWYASICTFTVFDAEIQFYDKIYGKTISMNSFIYWTHFEKLDRLICVCMHVCVYRLTFRFERFRYLGWWFDGSLVEKSKYLYWNACDALPIPSVSDGYFRSISKHFEAVKPLNRTIREMFFEITRYLLTIFSAIGWFQIVHLLSHHRCDITHGWEINVCMCFVSDFWLVENVLQWNQCSNHFCMFTLLFLINSLQCVCADEWIEYETKIRFT